MPKPLALRLHTSLPAQRCVQASGSRRELGLQHGRQLQGAIHQFLADRRARVEALVMDAQSHATLSARCLEHARVIEHHLPDMAEEVHGLAEGAGIDIGDAYLLQLRRELVGFSAMPRLVATQGDCTTFGRCREATALVGQTVDLNGDMAREATALDITHTDGRRLLMLSFTGLLGYLGMNDRGLAIGLNLVLGGQWQAGIPEYMLIRHLLDTCDSVDQALDSMSALPLASSRALTLCDGRRLVTVEHVLNDFVLFEGEELMHTNHFLHPRFQPQDELNPFARGFSLRRLDACTTALRNLPFDAQPAQYMQMLDTPPIDVPPKDDIRRECTVASALMRIREGEMIIHPRGPGPALH